MNFGRVLHFTFCWRKTRSFFKYIGLVWLLCLLFLASLAVLAFFLFKGLALALLSGSYSSFNAMLPDPMLAGATAITFFLASIPVFFIFFLLAFLAQALIIVFSLKQAALDGLRLNLLRFFTLFFIAIASFAAAVVSFYNKKMLLLLLFATIFLFASRVPLPSLQLGSTVIVLVLFLAYFVTVIYNLVRLSFSGTVFLNKNCFFSQALKESWNITAGNFWKIIVAFVIVILLLVVASIILLISLSFLVSFILSTFFAANFVVSFVLAAFASMIFLCPFQMLCYNFAFVNVYKQLSEGAKILHHKK